jgi:lipid-binding SYLF domain-containing protein
MPTTRRMLLVTLPIVAAGARVGSAYAASASKINSEADQALRKLYATEAKAVDLSRRAKGILIFPRITKAGLIIGGQSGDGVLRVGGRSRAYYNISAVSFGLQAGGQTFSYAMFLMTDNAIDYLNKSDGWQLGSGPSVVLVDKGAAASMTTTTLTQDVYAFAFGQSGLMAGLGLEGSKITKINPGS